MSEELAEKLAYQAEGVTVYLGDCLEVLAHLPEASVDSVVCDPPYGLEFMGKQWDRLGDVRQPGDETFHEGTGPFGRAKVRHGGAPSYGSTGAGKISSPGIGDRETPWPSNAGWNGFRCRNCGHLSHGGSPCRCDAPDFAAADGRTHAMQAWHQEWAEAVYRVLKPGGHLVSFGGTRTYHRLACAIEDAGFEIRDSIAWMRPSEPGGGDATEASSGPLLWVYGSGFP